MDKLKSNGVTVMLPKAWAQMETKAKLETHEARDPAEAATKKHIGMNKLVDYNWRMSVGDVELTEEEMEDLVNSKSGLIQLRGKWVMADKQVVSQVSGYMDALREKAIARKKKELEQLAATCLLYTSPSPRD